MCKAMVACTYAHRWSVGDVLCCNNERAMHARTSFENDPAGSPRKLVVAFSKT
jgi:alpha-ketoglutarate-dependent taurine dioxygenase